MVVVARFLIELVSNRQRVLKGPKCSWVLPAASRLSSQSSGCSPRPPRSRSGDWRVRQARDAAGGAVGGSFRGEGSKGRERNGRPLNGYVVGDVVEEGGGSFRGGGCRCSMLKALDCPGPRLQGAFVTRSGCTQSWAGPGGSRGGGLCGHWAPGPGWETDPFP